MKEYKVVCLEEYGGVVCEGDIEKALNEMDFHGWTFVQMSSGGGGESGFFVSWVYLIFRRQ